MILRMNAKNLYVFTKTHRVFCAVETKFRDIIYIVFFKIKCYNAEHGEGFSHYKNSLPCALYTDIYRLYVHVYNVSYSSCVIALRNSEVGEKRMLLISGSREFFTRHKAKVKFTLE